MELLILDVDHEVADARGRRRLFVRVAAWWGDTPNTTTPPDAVLDFLLPAPPTIVRRFDDVDSWHRRTRSNKVLPATVAYVEVDGEWVPMGADGPPGDPWRVITEPIADPLLPLWPIINDVARTRQQQQWRGPDTFAPGEVTIDASHRQTADGKAIRGVLGARRTIRAA